MNNASSDFWASILPLLGGIGAGLFAISLLHDRLVQYLHRTGRLDGRSSIMVIIGVTYTLLAAVPLIGWRNTAVLFLLFAASGTPMAGGQLWRYISNLYDYLQRLQEEKADGETERVA